MTISGVLDSLVAAGIWAFFAYCAYVTNKRFKQLHHRIDELAKRPKSLLLSDMPFEQRMILIAYLRVQRDSMISIASTTALFLICQIMGIILYSIFYNINIQNISINPSNIQAFTNLIGFVLLLVLIFNTVFALYKDMSFLAVFDDAFLDGLSQKLVE
jgi:hypothetical protein